MSGREPRAGENDSGTRTVQMSREDVLDGVEAAVLVRDRQAALVAFELPATDLAALVLLAAHRHVVAVQKAASVQNDRELQLIKARSAALQRIRDRAPWVQDALPANEAIALSQGRDARSDALRERRTGR